MATQRRTPPTPRVAPASLKMYSTPGLSRRAPVSSMSARAVTSRAAAARPRPVRIAGLSQRVPRAAGQSVTAPARLGSKAFRAGLASDTVDIAGGLVSGTATAAVAVADKTASMVPNAMGGKQMQKGAHHTVQYR